MIPARIIARLEFMLRRTERSAVVDTDRAAKLRRDVLLTNLINKRRSMRERPELPIVLGRVASRVARVDMCGPTCPPSGALLFLCCDERATVFHDVAPACTRPGSRVVTPDR